jgi:nitrite reductase/ring-hydroxylating ferredoxin subunit/uncharacterized membrane protein
LRSARPATLAERLERAQALDRPVSALADLVVQALPTGRATDALHGVPFGQPAHPAMVRVPVGCWTSAVLLDLIGGRGAERASATLIAAGVAAALPAAAAGVADWSALHPHQQRVGLVHAAAAGTATALFAGSLLARLARRRGRGRALAAGGFLAATAGAYLGGHLALRLGAGASHAEPIGHLAALGWQDLCPLAELPQRQPVRRQLGYLGVLVVRDGDTVQALADQCAHLGGPLHQGRVERAEGRGGAWTERRDRGTRERSEGRQRLQGAPERAGNTAGIDGVDCVTCPWHGSTFRLADGSVLHGPSTARQPAFDTQVTGAGLVQVRPQGPPGGAFTLPPRGARWATRASRPRF